MPRPSQCPVCGCFSTCLNPSAAQCAERTAIHVDERIAEQALDAAMASCEMYTTHRAQDDAPEPAPVPTLVDLRTASAHEINTALKHWRGWRLAFDTSTPTDAPLDWDIETPDLSIRNTP